MKEKLAQIKSNRPRGEVRGTGMKDQTSHDAEDSVSS